MVARWMRLALQDAKGVFGGAEERCHTVAGLKYGF